MIAAIVSAIRGVSARVETDVAIALAASWNPFVGDLLECVDRVLEGVDDVLELEHLERLVLSAEELRQDPSVALVAGVLQPVDLDPVLLEVLHRLQPGHRLGGQLRTPLEYVDLVGQPSRELLDLVEDGEVDRLLHEVHDVVETRSEGIDVLAVERRHEGGVDPLRDLVGRLVGTVLGVPHAVGDGRTIGGVTEHLGQDSGAFDQVGRRLCQQLVEDVVHRLEAQGHGCTPRRRIRTGHMLGPGPNRRATREPGWPSQSP
jgi:hypothetical protein